MKQIEKEAYELARIYCDATSYCPRWNELERTQRDGWLRLAKKVRKMVNKARAEGFNC